MSKKKTDTGGGEVLILAVVTRDWKVQVGDELQEYEKDDVISDETIPGLGELLDSGAHPLREFDPEKDQLITD